MALTTPATWVALAQVTALQMNTEVRDQMNALLAAPTSYTPTWTASTTNPTIGNGTITGEWWTIGNKFLRVVITITVGSTTTVGTGNYSIGLPSAGGTPAAGRKSLTGTFYDTSVPNTYVIVGEVNGTNTMSLTNGGFPVGNITAAAPVVPANGDQYHFDIEYRIA